MGKRMPVPREEMTGEELKRLRAAAQVSQQWLASQIKVWVSTISRWECGASKINGRNARVLRDILKAPARG